MRPRKQHFIPRFYLQGFANECEQVWAYRRDSKGGKLYRTNIGDVCAIRDLYEVRVSNTPESRFIEPGMAEFFLNKLEDSFAPSVEFLRKYNPDDPTFTAEAVWEHLYITCAFVSNLIIRNPHWLYSQRKHAKELTRRLASKGFFTPNDIFELKKLGYDSDLTKVVELGIQHSELFSIQENSSMTKLGETLSNMSILLLKAPSSSKFITSSFPFTVTWADMNDDDPDMIYFPLSSSSALVFKKEEHFEFFCSNTTDEFVKSLNINLLTRHDLWETAIARERTTLESCLNAVSLI